MPLYWRYCLSYFLKIFSCCLGALLALLFLTRFHEATQLFTLGAQGKEFALFIIYQFPYIFPIATPISVLIACYLTMRHFSTQGILIALRSAGFSLQKICTPLFISSLFLCLSNVYLVSETACDCHLASKRLVQTLTLQNPELLFKRAALIAHHGTFSQLPLVPVVMASTLPTGPVLYTFRDITWDEDGLQSNHSSIVAVQKNTHDGFDTLLVENNKKTALLLPPLQRQWLLKEARLQLKPDHLNTRLLFGKYQAATNISEKKACISECFRRIGFLLFPLTFCALGLSFGIIIDRKTHLQRTLVVALATAIILSAFFMAPHYQDKPLITALLYLLPQSCAFIGALFILRRRSLGVA